MTFHSIDSSGSVLSYPRKTFEALLAALDRTGLPVISLSNLLDNETQQGIALTFDDGMKSVITDALPVLTEFDAPAHLFLTTGALGGDNRWPGQPAAAPAFDMLNWDDVEALHATGVHIEGHTVTHPDLRSLSDEEIETECGTANDQITRKLGVSPRYFAYPYGYHDDRVRAIARKYYRACTTTELQSLGRADDPAKLPRLDSYYLQSDYILENLATLPVQAYLTFRHTLRRVRRL